MQVESVRESSASNIFARPTCSRTYPYTATPLRVIDSLHPYHSIHVAPRRHYDLTSAAPSHLDLLFDILYRLFDPALVLASPWVSVLLVIFVHLATELAVLWLDPQRRSSKQQCRITKEL